MRIHIGFDIALTLQQATPMLMMLNVHPSRRGALIVPDLLRLEPQVPLATYVDGFGNLCTRVVAPAGLFRISTDAMIADSGLPDRVVPRAREVPIEALPSDTLVFLLGSRYCETDTLSRNGLGRCSASVTPGWARVQAIVDFVHDHVEFGYPHARATRTALRGSREQARRMPRLRASRDHAVPLHEHSGALRHRLSRRHRRAAAIPRRWISAPGSRSSSTGGWYTFDARHNRRASAASSWPAAATPPTSP